MHLNKCSVHQLLYYIFAQNLWYPHPRFFFGEAWSLAVEEWFYLLFPFCIYFMYQWLKPVRKQAFFLKVLLVFIATFILLRILNALHPGPISQDAGIRKVVVLRLDALAYGVLVAYLAYFRKGWVRRNKEKLFGIGIVGMLLMYYLMDNHGMDICNATHPVMKFCSDAFLYLLLPIIFALLLPYANSVVTTPYSSLKKGVQFISKISYSLYLVHFSLIYIPFFDGLKMEQPVLLCLTYLGYWVVTISLSYLLYRYFELPMMNLRDRYYQND